MARTAEPNTRSEAAATPPPALVTGGTVHVGPVETPAGAAILSVNNIEVVYDHVILVLKGVSLAVPTGQIVALLGANGAGKSTTLKAISNLLHAERGEVTKGAIVFEGAQVQTLTPNELVRRGCIQVMEGRHCFGHLTVEENLLTGAFTRRDGRAAIKRDLERVYAYFPRLAERRGSMAGYTSGGEQQMCAIGRALMSRPKMILLDEPSMGLAPQIVEEIFEIVKSLNDKEGVSFLLAEQNTNMALKYAQLRLHSGEWPRGARRRGACAARERGRQGVLPRRRRGQAQVVPRRQALQAAQALAGVSRSAMTDLLRRPGNPRRRLRARRSNSPACRRRWRRRCAHRAGPRSSTASIPQPVTSRAALAKLPILRKSDLVALQKTSPPFGGFNGRRAEQGQAPADVAWPDLRARRIWERLVGRGARAVRRRLPRRRHRAQFLRLSPDAGRLHARVGGCTRSAAR